jgi:CHAT domain-containing protein
LDADAPSVVVNLWNVDDAATSELMVVFHRHLKQGLSKVEALRRAQSDTRARYPHPRYWAAFVLNGAPGKHEHD